MKMTAVLRRTLMRTVRRVAVRMTASRKRGRQETRSILNCLQKARFPLNRKLHLISKRLRRIRRKQRDHRHQPPCSYLRSTWSGFSLTRIADSLFSQEVARPGTTTLPRFRGRCAWLTLRHKLVTSYSNSSSWTNSKKPMSVANKSKISVTIAKFSQTASLISTSRRFDRQFRLHKNTECAKSFNLKKTFKELEKYVEIKQTRLTRALFIHLDH